MAVSRSRSSNSAQSGAGLNTESPTEPASPANNRSSSRTRAGRRRNASTAASPASQVSQISNSLRSRVRRRQAAANGSQSRLGRRRRNRRNRIHNRGRQAIVRQRGQQAVVRQRGQQAARSRGQPAARSEGRLAARTVVRRVVGPVGRLGSRRVRRPPTSGLRGQARLRRQQQRQGAVRPVGRPRATRAQATQTEEPYGYDEFEEEDLPIAPRRRRVRRENPRFRRSAGNIGRRIRALVSQRQGRRSRLNRPVPRQRVRALTARRVPRAAPLPATYQRPQSAYAAQANLARRGAAADPFSGMAEMMRNNPMFSNLFSGQQRQQAASSLAGQPMPVADPVEEYPAEY